VIEKTQQTHCDAPVAAGTPVRTACKGITLYAPGIPCAEYRDQAVYFCLPECKRDFELNPVSSCLASRLGEFEPGR